MIIAGSPRPTPLPEKLSSRTRNTLARSGITTVEEVMDAYPIRLLKLPGFGMIALRDIEKALFPWQQYMPARKKPGRKPKLPTGPVLHELYFDARSDADLRPAEHQRQLTSG